jgi:hypothetical protein
VRVGCASPARSYRASGVPEGIVMKIGGWKTCAMFDRYDIRDEEDLRDAAAQVASVRDKGAKAELRGQKHRNLLR